jgi:hypothetical protein
VQSVITYGFPVIRYNAEQCEQLNRIMITPIRRSLTLPLSTSKQAIFAEARLLDTEALWQKSAISFAHKLHRTPTHPASQIYKQELSDFNDGLIPIKRPQYARSFIQNGQLHLAEQTLNVKHDQHFENQMLKKASMKAALRRYTSTAKRALFLDDIKNDLLSDLQSSHLSSVNHYLLGDPPEVIALRARIRFDCSLLNSSLYSRHIIDSDNCPHCPAGCVETLSHCLFDCPHYAAARSKFISSLSQCDNVPDQNDPDFQHAVLNACLGLDCDSKLRDFKQTPMEKATGKLLLEIAELRPDL